MGAAASTIEQDENGVTVDISTTSSGAEVKEKARFAYVIGADGGHSVYFSLSCILFLFKLHDVVGTVRKALGLSFVGETRESEKRYIADVRLKGFSEKDLHFFTFGQSGEKSYA